MKYFLSAFALFVLPVMALAQFGDIDAFVLNINQFINNVLVPLVFAVAFLVFIWGVFNFFILGGGDEEKQSKGKSLMLYAIVGFVLMISIWGIVNLLAGGLFDDTETIQNIPNVPSRNN